MNTFYFFCQVLSHDTAQRRAPPCLPVSKMQSSHPALGDVHGFQEACKLPEGPKPREKKKKKRCSGVLHCTGTSWPCWKLHLLPGAESSTSAEMGGVESPEGLLLNLFFFLFCSGLNIDDGSEDAVG